MTVKSDVLSPAQTWAAVGAERAALADDLARLSDDQWRHPTLCGRWSVAEVVAHLTAGAVITGPRWIRSVIAARFDFGRHNDRRLAEQLGTTPAETLERFQSVVSRRTSPFGPPLGWLGETIIHAQDLRRPLGITTAPPLATLAELARFLVRNDFTVASRKMAKGLHLRATDLPFEAGRGPEVSGPLLALVMAMAGRAAYCEDLTGQGLATLRSRCPAP
jgi:uncharacterized protein (TIGR03083 family)